MNIYAVLIWYDERPDWLAATVASVAGFCDGIIAFDGAYFLFPNALRHPTSGAMQATTILETATAAGMSCTLHIPQGPWIGNEVGKLQAVMDRKIGTPFEDWYFKIDADELLTDIPDDARRRLEETDLLAAELRMWERAEGASENPMWPIRRLYRVLPEMTYGPAHHILHATVDGERVCIADSELRARRTLALDLPDLRMEHRSRARSQVQLERKERYYRQRDDLGVEREMEVV